MSVANPQTQVLIETDDIISALRDNVRPGDTLLVTSQGFKRRGITHRIESGIHGSVFTIDNITSHPQLEDVYAWLDKCVSKSISNIIGLGGGSVIDVCKVLTGLLSSQAPSLQEVIEDKLSLQNAESQLIVIPTTAGTGAEVTSFATLWDNTTNRKYSVVCDRPDIVIFEPGLSCSLPLDLTLYSALDATSHAVESLWNVNRNVKSEALALNALEALIENVPKVMLEPSNREVRRQLQQAAYYAGAAINITKTAVAHAISYPLTLHYGVPHGLACSFTIKAIIEDLGATKLKIPQAMADNLLRMLNSLPVAEEMAKYKGWRDMFSADNFYLDPSRSENFIVEVDNEWAKKIVLSSAQI